MTVKVLAPKEITHTFLYCDFSLRNCALMFTRSSTQGQKQGISQGQKSHRCDAPRRAAHSAVMPAAQRLDSCAVTNMRGGELLRQQQPRWLQAGHHWLHRQRHPRGAHGVGGACQH